MKVALDKIDAFWKKADYDTIPHKSSGTLMVKMDDEIFELMQEH
jgi:hypothetical protein